MAARVEALLVETAAWTLSLKTTADPGAQLSRLALALGRPTDDPSLAGGLEVDAPGWQKPASPMPPRVFENTTYTLTVRPRPGYRLGFVRHPFRSDVEDSLEEAEDGTWRGALRTGNDLGWFPLEIGVSPTVLARPRTDRLAFEVWPLKLDFGRDFRALTAAIEKDYPLWLFRFLAPTRHDAGDAGRQGDPFLLEWTAQFQRLWEGLERGLRVVVERPHMRLSGSPTMRRADAIRGRLGRRIEETLPALRRRPERTIVAESWSASLDTLENRFVLGVIESCLEGLDRFQAIVDKPGLSPSFRLLLSGWIRALRVFRGDPLFRGLEPLSGLSQESLVLQNRAGYSAVYRSWLGLRRHLEFFARLPSTRMGMRTVDEIYEIWCFLELRNVLLDLGFTLIDARHPRWRRQGLERELVDGFGSAFEFLGPSGLSLRLSHEPVFSLIKGREYRSFTVSQRPDIVLEASWSDPGEEAYRRLLWIFDAKYRLKTPDSAWDRDADQGRTSEFLAPPDALDQMHRYRDSILLALDSGKSRPVVSAFALYPSPIDQELPEDRNPYSDAIAEVGIGAFPLLPGPGGSTWLSAYLRQALDVSGPGELTDRTSVRIPVTGLEYVEEDTLVAFASECICTEGLESLREGRAHDCRVSLGESCRDGRLTQVRYLAVALPGPSQGLEICGAYLIRSRKASPDGAVLDFSLGSFIPLYPALECPGPGPGKSRITSLSRLFNARNASGLWAMAYEQA